MEQEKHGWYSEKQLQRLINRKYHIKTPKPYIYYLDQNNKIVQVTEVTCTSKITSNFDDVKYVGILSKFHSASETPKSMA